MSSHGEKGTLKICFGGTKQQTKPFWQPVILELKSHKSGTTLRYAVTDFEKEIKDDPNTGVSCFEIRDLDQGPYSLTLLDFHTGHAILQEPHLTIQDDEFVYDKMSMHRRKKQPNTLAMDFVADAPYRLEKSCSYLPIVVFLKDIAPGEIRVKSIELSCYSPSDPVNPVPIPSGSIHMVFDNDGTRLETNGQPALLRFDKGKDYETVMTDPWYRIILLRRESLPVLQGKHLGYEKVRYLQYQVTVTYKRLFENTKQFVFRTLAPDSDLPRVKEWYYGDTHYHSEFTDNPYEYGGPLSMTAEVARAVGLSWVTVTDHSYCLNHPKTPEEKKEGNRWKSYKEAIKRTNERYRDVLLVGAEEITVRRYFSGLHLLSFGNPFIEDEHPAGFGSVTMKEVFERLRASGDKGGFIYAAHPSSEGYIWHEEDYEVATDPSNRDLFAGLEIFNEKILYKQTESSMDRDVLDPFAILDEGDRQRPWSKELQEGIRRHWVEKFLLPSLRDCQRTGKLRKYFVLAGSDAHMDFNYSFRPHPAFLIHYLNDNAFGKVRTFAYLPREDGGGLTEASLYKALRNGRTLLTDGPVVLFSLALEGGDVTYRFGDTVAIGAGKNLELSLEWQSTAEFGPLQKMNLYLGTSQGERDMSDQIGLAGPRVGDHGFQGQLKHVFSQWTESPCYLRLEASSVIDPAGGEELFRCVTNPIWIVTES